MNGNDLISRLWVYLRRPPEAYAILKGGPEYPEIIGRVRFYRVDRGAVVVTTVRGLPFSTEPCSAPFFAFHIHGGESCTGDAEDSFKNAMMHYNPGNCHHPHHSGDLPPLLGADGYAFGAVLTDRFTVDEIVGRTVIIHSSPDDFTTQPAGNAGKKIACGEIIANYRGNARRGRR